MAYELTAVVAAEALLRAKAEWPQTRVVGVRRGIGVMPLPWRVLNELNQRYGKDVVAGGPSLPAWLAARLALWSHDGPVAYVEASFHGGLGGQTAWVWKQAHRVLAVSMSMIAPAPSSPPTPISQALQYLGVTVGAGVGLDEFDAVGLGLHRRTESWLEEDQGTHRDRSPA